MSLSPSPVLFVCIDHEHDSKAASLISQSQLDWKSHTSSTAGLADELATNRRSGGFLEKRDFLERVDDRRSGAYEQTKRGR